MLWDYIVRDALQPCKMLVWLPCQIADPLRRPKARKLLESDMPLCYWDKGECGAAFWLDAPDDTLLQIRNKTKVRLLLDSQIRRKVVNPLLHHAIILASIGV